MKIEQKYSLKEVNTFGLDVKAKRFSIFKSIDELIELFTEVKDDEYFILGGGSNILFTQDFKGFVLKNEIKGVNVDSESDNEITLKVGGGENWHDFVLFCIDNEYGGVENMSLIPGTVGAAPIQNIGAYGIEQKDVFVKLEALNLSTMEIEVFDKKRCNFGYRDSFFKKWGKGNYVILNVFYALTKTNHILNTSYGDIESQPPG